MLGHKLRLSGEELTEGLPQVGEALRGCFSVTRLVVREAFDVSRDPEFWLGRLREAWGLAWRMDREGLRRFDERLHVDLTESERVLSLARFRDLEGSLEGAWHLGMAGWLIRERLAGRLDGHFLSLYTARAVEFQLVPTSVELGWLRWLNIESGGVSAAWCR